MKRLAWGLFALWVATAALAIALDRGDTDKFALVSPALAGFALAGALVATRQPRNAIGWMLLAIAILFALTNAVDAYVHSRPHPAPFAMWLDNWVQDVWIGIVGVWVPLLFPDGRLPSPRWRWVAGLGTAAFAAGVLAKAFGAQALDIDLPGAGPNPYALPGAVGHLLATLTGPAVGAYGPAVLGAMVGLVVRLRRARGLERQQLKWFAFVGTLMLGALLLAALSLIVPGLPGAVGDVGWVGFITFLLLGLPVAIANSILRHRLYDIDVVIRRTLIYGALTAALAAAYLALVLLIGLAAGRSGFAVAASTLAVAALVRPLRARIQGAVDQRFYRRRYDAAHTLEAFGTRLRHELDLEALAADLRSVVDETVQPAHVSLWLRP